MSVKRQWIYSLRRAALCCGHFRAISLMHTPGTEIIHYRYMCNAYPRDCSLFEISVGLNLHFLTASTISLMRRPDMRYSSQCLHDYRSCKCNAYPFGVRLTVRLRFPNKLDDAFISGVNRWQIISHTYPWMC